MTIALDENGRILGFFNSAGGLDIPIGMGADAYKPALGPPVVFTPQGIVGRADVVATYGEQGAANIDANQNAAAQAAFYGGGPLGAVVGAPGPSGIGGILLIAGGLFLAMRLMKGG